MIPNQTMMAILLAICGAMTLVSLGDLRTAAPAAIATLLLWGGATTVLLYRKPPTISDPTVVLIVGLVVRAILILSPASLSDDLFRYLWEGASISLGENPYLSPPSDAMVHHPDDPILAQVNHPTISTIYPPLALWVFAALSAVHYDPIIIKIFMGTCDALIAWGLAAILLHRKRAITAAWLYALHPLGAVESAGSGHLESLAILLMVLAILTWDRKRSGLGWAGMGALIKVLPVVLIPLLWRRSPWLLLPVVLLGVTAVYPFIDAGPTLWRGLGTYAHHWSFNSPTFPILSTVFHNNARMLVFGLWVLIVGWAMRRHTDPAVVALYAGGAFVLLSPTVHPWYIGWAWVPALICGVRAWTVLATLVPLSYAALASYDVRAHSWEEPIWPVWVQFTPFLIVLLWEFAKHQTQPGPWAPGAPPQR